MSASRTRQTMAKMARERAVKERRALKREKKQAAAELRRGTGSETATGELSDAERAASTHDVQPDS